MRNARSRPDLDRIPEVGFISSRRAEGGQGFAWRWPAHPSASRSSCPAPHFLLPLLAAADEQKGPGILRQHRQFRASDSHESLLRDSPSRVFGGFRAGPLATFRACVRSPSIRRGPPPGTARAPPLPRSPRSGPRSPARPVESTRAARARVPSGEPEPSASASARRGFPPGGGIPHRAHRPASTTRAAGRVDGLRPRHAEHRGRRRGRLARRPASGARACRI